MRSAPALTPLPAVKFDSGTGERALKSLLRRGRRWTGFGSFRRAELSAAGALIGYLELTQKGKLPALAPLAREAAAHFMAIDAATRRNLELTETLSGERARQPLVGDRPHRDGGGRARAGGAPGRALDRCEKIAARQDAVALFVGRQRNARRACAKRCAARPTSPARWRGCRSARGGPRDLAALRDGISCGARACAISCEDDWRGEAGEARRRDLTQGIARCRALTDRLGICWWTSRPSTPATAASSAPARMRRSTRCAPCATNRAASSPRWKARYREESGAAAQDQAQWRARLFHRSRARSMPTS